MKDSNNVLNMNELLQTEFDTDIEVLDEQDNLAVALIGQFFFLIGW